MAAYGLEESALQPATFSFSPCGSQAFHGGRRKLPTLRITTLTTADPRAMSRIASQRPASSAPTPVGFLYTPPRSVHVEPGSIRIPTVVCTLCLHHCVYW